MASDMKTTPFGKSLDALICFHVRSHIFHRQSYLRHTERKNILFSVQNIQKMFRTSRFDNFYVCPISDFIKLCARYPIFHLCVPGIILRVFKKESKNVCIDYIYWNISASKKYWWSLGMILSVYSEATIKNARFLTNVCTMSTHEFPTVQG